MKALSVLNFEVIKTELDMQNNTEDNFKNKFTFILKQALHLENWITSLNPLDYENIDSTFRLKVKDDVLKKLSPRHQVQARSMDKIRSLGSVSNIAFRKHLSNASYNYIDNSIMKEILKYSTNTNSTENLEQETAKKESQRELILGAIPLDPKISQRSIMKTVTPTASKVKTNPLNSTMDFYIDNKYETPLRYKLSNDITKKLSSNIKKNIVSSKFQTCVYVI